MPHQPWITVWTHGSGIAPHGYMPQGYPEETLQHFSLDVEKLNKPLYTKRTLYLGDEHQDVYREPGYGFYISGKITSDANLPREFGPKNIVAVAVLDLADALPLDTKKELLLLLDDWRLKVEKTPPFGGPGGATPSSGEAPVTAPTVQQQKRLEKEMQSER